MQYLEENTPPTDTEARDMLRRAGETIRTQHDSMMRGEANGRELARQIFIIGKEAEVLRIFVVQSLMKNDALSSYLYELSSKELGLDFICNL
ncbi:hypothetical protein F3Y22_tig00111566pilonHSYRG00080 [Hibiscus syriacus]|uniref:Uncharacterized protein n=1 Tax=Hibiscus syriacus TaxID=106335 RepID=A0A6A2YDP9_HIBSY|nr:hypothetical protein F3Y22_tig00111566pilonHSYRG00080 [Hibiscus syriacus]